jgi:response regulator of citrate/malate metabolism
MKKTFKTHALYHADSASGIYRMPIKSNKKALQEAHEEFTASELGKSLIAMSSTRRVYTEYCFFGEWLPLPKGADLDKYVLGKFKLR